ncbi:MAG: hypothetical protein WBK55_00785 [Alphaproteobacteria bacterium]
MMLSRRNLLKTGAALCVSFLGGCNPTALQDVTQKKTEAKPEDLAASARRELAAIVDDANALYNILISFDQKRGAHPWVPFYVMSDRIKQGNILPGMTVINVQNPERERLDELGAGVTEINSAFSSMLWEKINLLNPEEKKFRVDEIASVNALTLIQAIGLTRRYEAMISMAEKAGIIKEPVYVSPQIFDHTG